MTSMLLFGEFDRAHCLSHPQHLFVTQGCAQRKKKDRYRVIGIASTAAKLKCRHSRMHIFASSPTTTLRNGPTFVQRGKWRMMWLLCGRGVQHSRRAPARPGARLAICFSRP